ncbi:uncharacterized protein A4U43_C07F18460 [Asparagus officinalis]|uniref:Uncharacterized protein n=1 Tax=Asparagus officinalis TaxID=4686 RepID=A0A5P1ED51_ASPOF|nr:uncharacterized protein A4U43_C07F18460 [Asparagus officinalis]
MPKQRHWVEGRPRARKRGLMPRLKEREEMGKREEEWKRPSGRVASFEVHHAYMLNLSLPSEFPAKFGFSLALSLGWSTMVGLWFQLLLGLCFNNVHGFNLALGIKFSSWVSAIVGLWFQLLFSIRFNLVHGFSLTPGLGLKCQKLI